MHHCGGTRVLYYALEHQVKQLRRSSGHSGNVENAYLLALLVGNG
jgi:ribosomal protein L18